MDPERSGDLTSKVTDRAINYLRKLEFERKIIKYELNENLIFLIDEVSKLLGS